jgi:hypothetical protein
MVMKPHSYTLGVGFLCIMQLATGCMAQNPERDVTPGAQTLLPPRLPDNVGLFNPMSGPHALLIQYTPDLNFQPLNPRYMNAAPLSGLPSSEYGRLSWHSLEPSEGRYNFSIIDNVLAPCPPPQGKKVCLPQGVTFGFRIEALNPQVKSVTNVTTGRDGYPVYADVPAYLEDGKHGWLLPVNPEDEKQGHYFIPDWNDSLFLKRMEALLSALGQKYDGDPRIGWVDIGLYGNWGEWHTAGLPDAAHYTRGIPYASSSPYYNLNTLAYLSNNGKPGAYQVGTIATKNFIVDAYVRAFPKTQLVMLTGDGDALCHALRLPDSDTHIGLRRDSLGSGNGWNWQFQNHALDCDSPGGQDITLDRWKTAPFIAEPYGNGSSPAFPCRTFETDPHNGSYNIEEQVLQFHIASIKNGAICAGTWNELSTKEQQAWFRAGFHSGYRFTPIEIYIPEFPKTPSGNRSMSIQTHWTNTGVTPAYNAWRVEFSLWTYDGPIAEQREIALMTSQIELRKVLPTESTPAVVNDVFELQNELMPGRYELRIRVVDPKGFMNPMQLALKNQRSEGYYPLGFVTIPEFSPH